MFLKTRCDGQFVAIPPAGVATPAAVYAKVVRRHWHRVLSVPNDVALVVTVDSVPHNSGLRPLDQRHAGSRVIGIEWPDDLPVTVITVGTGRVVGGA